MRRNAHPLSPYLDGFRHLNGVDVGSSEDKILIALASERMSPAWTNLFARDKGPATPIETRVHALLRSAFQSKNAADNLSLIDMNKDRADREHRNVTAAADCIEAFYRSNGISAPWQLIPCLERLRFDADETHRKKMEALAPGLYTSVKRNAATCFAVNFGMHVNLCFGTPKDGFHHAFTAFATNTVMDLGPDDEIDAEDVRKALNSEGERRARASLS